MKTLNLFAVDDSLHLVYPEEFHYLTPEDPAMTVFTDFKQHTPQSVSYDVLADEAEVSMRQSHVRLKVVLDADGEMIGAISLNELDEQHFFQVFQLEGLKRNEVQVKDLMIPRHKLKALDYAELSRASVQNLMDTMKENYQQHCLVVDTERGQIRGLISATDIARRLHIPVEIGRPTSFYDIFMAMKH